jgi:hypothetical protein
MAPGEVATVMTFVAEASGNLAVLNFVFVLYL